MEDKVPCGDALDRVSAPPRVAPCRERPAPPPRPRAPPLPRALDGGPADLMGTPNTLCRELSVGDGGADAAGVTLSTKATSVALSGSAASGLDGAALRHVGGCPVAPWPRPRT